MAMWEEGVEGEGYKVQGQNVGILLRSIHEL